MDFDLGAGSHYLSLEWYESKCFLVKYDSLFNLEWLNTWEGDDNINSFRVTDYGTILLTIESDGVFGPFDVDPGPGVVFAEGSEEDRLNIVALNLDGEYLWYDNIEVYNINVHTVLSPNPNTLFLGGVFFGRNWECPDCETDFDPHPDFTVVA